MVATRISMSNTDTNSRFSICINISVSNSRCNSNFTDANFGSDLFFLIINSIIYLPIRNRKMKSKHW